MACDCENNSYNNSFYYASPVNLNCEYTLEMMLDWKEKIICAKDAGLINSEAIYNKYMGIILSGINFSSNICYLVKDLDSIKPAIINIINSGVC